MSRLSTCLTAAVPIESDLDAIKIFAHRGFSSRRPEMTRAAYAEAIAFAASEQIELGLECDVQFGADDQLICLHDLLLDRTAAVTGPAFARTTDELAAIDFGSWGPWAARDEQGARVPGDDALVRLEELFRMVEAARRKAVAIVLNVETKHPNPRGFTVDDRVAEMVIDRGWDAAAGPVRVISFAPASLVRIGGLLPQIRRTYLVERTLAPVIEGRLPDGIDIVGPDLRLVRADPDFVARARWHGNEVHVWTVNEPDDIEFCLDLGVTGFTTDCPDRVLAVLRGRR